MFSGMVLLVALATTNLEQTLEARAWVRARAGRDKQSDAALSKG
jgi:hypothetical protein